MQRPLEDKLKVSLTGMIRQWLEKLELEPHESLPYLGDSIEEIMAGAALTVMRGIADAEQSIRDQGLLND